MDNNNFQQSQTGENQYNGQQYYGDQQQYTGQHYYAGQPYCGDQQNVTQQQYAVQSQINVQATQGMVCPKCGSNNLQVLQETSTKGKDFSGSKGCCGAILFGPIGILCGSCGKGKQMSTQSYWLCYNCGNKFKL